MSLTRINLAVVVAVGTLLCSVNASADTFNINFDEFTSPPVTCCFSTTGVHGPLYYPSVTVATYDSSGSVMNSTGWHNLQTSGNNLFGATNTDIVMYFHFEIEDLAFDVINGSSGAYFGLSLYGEGDVFFRSYTSTYLPGLPCVTTASCVYHFATTDSGVLKAVVEGNYDFAVDTISFSTSIIPPPTTPEPVSLILLGTGALGLAAAVRSKIGL